MCGDFIGNAIRQNALVSSNLTSKQCHNLIKAGINASIVGKPFNRFITINWSSVGLSFDECGHATSRFIKLARDWIRRQGFQITWLYVREGDRGYLDKGDHVHFLFHIPESIIDIFLKKMVRRWVEHISGCKQLKGTVLTKTIGRNANVYLVLPKLYQDNLDKLIRYLLKGANQDTAHGLGSLRSDEGGYVFGRRSDISRNLTSL